MHEFSVNDWMEEMSNYYFRERSERVIHRLLDGESKTDLNCLGDVYARYSYTQGPMPWNSMIHMEAYLWNRKGGILDSMNKQLNSVTE